MRIVFETSSRTYGFFSGVSEDRAGSMARQGPVSTPETAPATRGLIKSQSTSTPKGG